MASSRLLLAAALLAVLVGGAGALAWWTHAATPGATAAYPVSIVGPEGTLFDGVVHVENATAFTALQAAAREAGLAVETEEYPGMGTYVRAIGPHAAHGASGWLYEIRAAGAGEEWVLGDRSAALKPLREGDALRWRWTDGTDA